MAALGKVPAENPKIEWLENEAMPRITTITASAASNATTFTNAADIFRVGDVVRFTAGGFGILITATAAGAVSRLEGRRYRSGVRCSFGRDVPGVELER